MRDNSYRGTLTNVGTWEKMVTNGRACGVNSLIGVVCSS